MPGIETIEIINGPKRKALVKAFEHAYDETAVFEIKRQRGTRFVTQELRVQVVALAHFPGGEGFVFSVTGVPKNLFRRKLPIDFKYDAKAGMGQMKLIT